MVFFTEINEFYLFFLNIFQDLSYIFLIALEIVHRNCIQKYNYFFPKQFSRDHTDKLKKSNIDFEAMTFTQKITVARYKFILNCKKIARISCSLINVYFLFLFCKQFFLIFFKKNCFKLETLLCPPGQTLICPAYRKRNFG